MTAQLFVSVEDVAAVLAQHHVWPRYDHKRKRSLWRCACGVEWDDRAGRRWIDIEDDHQATALMAAFIDRESTGEGDNGCAR